MWVGLLIFYVANVANVICRILRRSFSRKSGTLASEFNLLLRSQMPTMLIYAKIAAEHGISEDRVRQIIRSKDPPCPSLKGREKKTL